MFDYLSGKLAYRNDVRETVITVDVNGVGYLININARDFMQLPANNFEIKVYTYLNHKEDSMTLFGFLQREDRDIFKILTSVSGVGPKMGMTLLEEFEACELISLVIKGDYKELTRAKGVGPKLAQKIILELKDKLINIQNDIPLSLNSEIKVQDEQAIQEAQSILLSLGYEREEIKAAMSKSLTYVKDQNNSEEILKECLKILSI